MHVSLDSALGRQRRLNSVGESVLQIAPSAAAAYSLRSLTGADPKVVRVRRGSDNHEQDFTASEVSSGALTSFVNTQVVAPLDIQALSATGRDGDFLIAKSAYSLRSLGTRQATLAATGDTVARADGKFVVQVRRSSDDAVKSFTADEVTDGTLLAFVNTPTNGVFANTGYESFTNASASGFTASNTGSTGFAISDILDGVSGDSVSVSFDIDITNGSPSISLRTTLDGGSTSSNSETYTSSGSKTATLTANKGYVGIGFTEGDAPSNFTVSNFKIIADGLVKTWYDQSVTTQAGDTATGNHAVQATVEHQPPVVKAGIVVDKGIDFDGVSLHHLQPALLLPTIQNSTVIAVSTKRNNSTGYVAQINRGLDRMYIRHNVITIGNPAVNVSGSTTNDVRAIQTITATSGGLFTIFQDGTSIGTTNYTTDVGGGDSHIGSGNNGSAEFDGVVSELIVYATDQTDNRTAIEANIGEAYSITGIPAYDDEVDGFVETWYDQSGNSKDAIQTTANLQPVIVAAGVFQNGLKFDSDGSSSGTDFRTPIDSVELSNEPNAGFALVWVGNVNASQHNAAANHTVLGNLRNVQNFPTGTIGLSVTPNTGTVSFINEQGGSTKEEVVDTNALTPGDFGVLFFSYEDAESGVDPLLSVDGSVTTSGLSSLNSSSSNNIGIMTAISGNNTVRYGNSADGICKEVLLYTGDQKSKRAALETNIAAEYGITLS